jgi:hypothetical protein
VVRNSWISLKSFSTLIADNAWFCTRHKQASCIRLQRVKETYIILEVNKLKFAEKARNNKWHINEMVKPSQYQLFHAYID